MDDPDNGDGDEGAPPPPSLTEPIDVLNYIKRLIPVLMEEEPSEITPQFEKELKTPAVYAMIEKFIGEAQVRALLVNRLTKDSEDPESDVPPEITYLITVDIQFMSNKVMTVAFVKRGTHVESTKQLTKQVQTIHLSQESTYESLHALISSAIIPIFNSFVSKSGKLDDGDKMVPAIKKNFAELETGLVHLQQNIDIPEINLVIHPQILAAIKKAERESGKPKAQDFDVEDSTLLNALQAGVNRWIREVQKVTQLDRDPSSGTAIQEISFWLNLERALRNIQEKCDSVEVTLTLEVLRLGRRFHVTVKFDTDTGLKSALETVNDYQNLMKDFPLNDLLSATDILNIKIALVAIFTHLKKIRTTKYPIQRALKLIEAISKDLTNQLLKVLGTRRLMHITFDEFEKTMALAHSVFQTWDDEYEKVNQLLREISRRNRREESMRMMCRINPAHKKLQNRLDAMRKFRRQHEQLRGVIVRVLRPTQGKSNKEEDKDGGAVTEKNLDFSDCSTVNEVKLAYENVKEVDCLDTSKDGNEQWEDAMKRYEQRIDQVETRITARLRDQLGAAKNANEMFRIFSRFNALFVRQRIRGAIREYQTQLIQRVKDDIDALHDKFKVQYPHSAASKGSKTRDLPPVSGSIIWARQIDQQLTMYLKRVEDVLGKTWERHVEGQKLKADGDSFRQKLNTQQLFEDWQAKVTQRNLGVSGHIFSIQQQRNRSGKNIKKLNVNFHPEIITLSKEVRNLKWLGFRVQLAIVNKAHQANQLYPFAISLIESMRSYERTCQKIEERESIAPLVAGLKKEVQTIISDGIALVWESYKLDPYVQKLAEGVLNLQEKVDDLMAIEERIDVEVRALETCPFKRETFRAILDQVQKYVDQLNLQSYTNLQMWVQNLDTRVGEKLTARLVAGMKAWHAALSNYSTSENAAADEENLGTGFFKPGGEPNIPSQVHDVVIVNQEITVHPPIDKSRAILTNHLNGYVGTICGLSTLQSTRYTVGIEVSAGDTTHRNLLTGCEETTKSYTDCLTAIEDNLEKADKYSSVWLNYQSLWDMDMGVICSRVGENLNLWQTLLNDIKKHRLTIDKMETREQFGPMVVDYSQVQTKINMKYDTWHKEILSRFGQMLGESMGGFQVEINKARTDLESSSLDTSSTADAVQFVTYVQQLKRNMRQWQEQVESKFKVGDVCKANPFKVKNWYSGVIRSIVKTGIYIIKFDEDNLECEVRETFIKSIEHGHETQTFTSGQRILERQRFQFPNNWIYVDQIEGEWDAFCAILKKKDMHIQQQVSQLQERIISEDKALATRTQDLLAEWNISKPIQGNIKPTDALDTLVLFEKKFMKLKEERDNVAKAKEALELTSAGAPQDNQLEVILEEVKDLNEVWRELSSIWSQIDEWKEKPWLSISPRKVRSGLDALLNQCKAMPARLRSYSSYDYVTKVLRNFIKVNSTIVALKSEALKERHWKSMMKQLNVVWVMADLTLGSVWAVDLLKNEMIVSDIITTAQGEMALEEFLKQVREKWNSYELELIDYQKKCRLIKGWDDLFDGVREHINSVSAMKLSPFYKVFEEDALAWEDKLNRINSLFDVWIDVQRRWVYLDGIFSGSADIPHLLPVETGRFASISTEFIGLMKKVVKSPLIVNVLTINGVQRSLERLADLLQKIQKALGEYLERERAGFPRFYFVGDEDLLDIIGNSKNVQKIQKHFRKMFAGIANILLSEDDSTILGVSSREGEDLMFLNPIELTKHPQINDWLGLLEKEMRLTLATLLSNAVGQVKDFRADGVFDKDEYMIWIGNYQAQLVLLASQITWSESCDGALARIEGGADPSILKDVLQQVEETLNILADGVLQDQAPVKRKKMEQLITELVHQRDVTRQLIADKITSNKSFDWLCQMRFYYNPLEAEVLKQLSIRMANAQFNYGFEYLGVTEKLVQTPLTDRCYLTMTQALEERLGGSPFGPAGTGKTESVKALGNQLGRFVLVFNCDETFDFQAMGRIFVGLCQVGAWGCFDEFNRLEEKMLSACSTQIQTIQEALKEHKTSSDEKSSIQIELVGKQVKVSTDMAIFITMNPGYAGRSNLPDNLKKLFRSLAMTQPNRQLIAQVMLYSQGFRSAELLSNKIVPLFKLCQEQLSSQSHYDFGLRALKAVLVSAGNVKRDRIKKIRDDKKAQGEKVDEAEIGSNLPEQDILIQSVCETLVPKLVAEDIPLLQSLLSDVFPGIQYKGADMTALRDEIKKVCVEYQIVYGDNDEMGTAWVAKVLQLYQITTLCHGLMMVGPSGSGKSTAWRVLLKALTRLEGIEGVSHVIDPKAISKDVLYGTMDPNTREWTDGLFTHILRKIIDNVRGELNQRHWIIFDGDVDPEWVENLNSVLDDNKLLTLPNGERLSIPPNVRIMFEVQDLKYATLATVSRCGMIWFSEDVLSLEMLFYNYIHRLKNVPIDDTDRFYGIHCISSTKSISLEETPEMEVQRQVAEVIAGQFTPDGVVVRSLEWALNKEGHIMELTRMRGLGSLFSMLNECTRRIINYNNQHSDFPLSPEGVESYAQKFLIYSLLWSFTGDAKLSVRNELGDFLRSCSTIQMPGSSMPLIDYEPTIDGEWVPWTNKVPPIEVETHRVGAPDVVVPTLDTVRHENILYSWLAEHKPIVLCGPPGSGKTMTLFSALRSLPDMEVAGLNFSCATTPELLLKTFDQYCEYRKTPNGIIMSPIALNKWLILFCDEINLPDVDNYGTQRVISFIRQMVEHNGFYRTTDQQWVTLERIQFVGACNPPTDPGRKPLTQRFLRHVPIVYVDYPGAASLKQIYGTFNRAMLRMVPSLQGYWEPLTDAMVEFFMMTQENFTQDIQPHYVYSPREMTRWVRGIAEALRAVESLPVEGLVRIWAHEALRLFQDRLIHDEERKWTNTNIDLVARRHFPSMDHTEALKRPILYSNWLTKDYSPVDQEELRDYVKARLRVFYEEELDVPLVLFDEVLEHVLRIDRIFRQPQGHLLLIGVSGAGKTTLSRFVAWMNGLHMYQIKVHNKYSMLDFDEDLRVVLRRSGCKGDKIVFIMDESNVLDSGFLERINTLLANGEVPGLFEGDEYITLCTQIKEGAQKAGLMLDSNEELYKWFTQQVMLNLHIVFTMNPSGDGLKDKCSTSPALFNRCVLNWFGDWSNGALYNVGQEFTIKIDLDKMNYKAPDFLPVAYEQLPKPPTHRQAIVNAFVFIHQTMHMLNNRLSKRGQKVTAITPRHYLDFIQHYVSLYNEKRSDLEEQQLHLNVGLGKISDTVNQVEELRKSLAKKQKELDEKNELANQKLKQMMEDQQKAEQQKTESKTVREKLKVQNEAVAGRTEQVMKDLAEVEPAVRDAENAVKNIKRQHLVELKALANPPLLVKLTLECVCSMIGENVTGWGDIRRVLMAPDFISNVVHFDTESLTPKLRNHLKQTYFSQKEFIFENVDKASKACGPLCKWAIAVVSYSDMLASVDPMRREVARLQQEAAATEASVKDVIELITRLEARITQYKDEYKDLISEAQNIKMEYTQVQNKVERAGALISSLSQEHERWNKGSATFQDQMETLIGDVLLSSAFLAYAGYFDQQLRDTLFSTWSSHLVQAGISFRQDLARTEYLSNADERLHWQANCLPADDLCTENAIMMHRFNRYPLIIDPSGQATEFILNEYRDKKITKSSFLDDSFRKNLESALRFGNPILVQDCENYDAILNPVLNRELRRTGGRVLITIGDQDIDFSPSFNIFLSTRDPSVEFPPDLCSRVTFVNFTVTRSSLQSQCANRVLKSERPDVDKKRSDLLKLQGEFAVRLRHLEKALLTALNEAKGSILEDEKVIGTLETLKSEAAEIQTKVEETDVVMAEVESVTNIFRPLSVQCSGIFFAMETLSQIHYLYQYSLQFFLDIFESVVNSNPNLNNISGTTERLKIITTDLFSKAYHSIGRGMFEEDRLILANVLSQIYLKSSGSLSLDAEFNYILRATSGLQKNIPPIKGFTEKQVQAIHNLSTSLGPFKKFASYVQDNAEAVLHNVAANPVEPVLCWEGAESQDPITQALYKMIYVYTLRPDKVFGACRKFVGTVFGEEFVKDEQLDLYAIVKDEVKPNTPVLLSCVTGYDASGRVEDMATNYKQSLSNIAIGSAEGFSLAEKAINAASKNGKWVMLKNVHLAPGWLVQVEKKLHALKAHPNFRLFLTLEITPKIPVNLLRAGRIITFEPPDGIKANLLRTFNSISPARVNKAPNERARMYFLLAWFHAIVQERLRYTPLGWSKKYEFNESDLKCACDTIDRWLDDTAKGRDNLPPDKIPWDALCTLMSQSIYGGRIDNNFDQLLMNDFVKRIFQPATFESDFLLVEKIDESGNKLVVPDGLRREDFLRWMHKLPDNQTPAWLGLPNNADQVILQTKASTFVQKLLKMQTVTDDEDLVYQDLGFSPDSTRSKSVIGASVTPQWMQTLGDSVSQWLAIIPPEDLPALKRTVENIKDPLYRFFERECTIGRSLLKTILSDLKDVALVCDLKKKQTNYIRGLLSDLQKGIIPKSWVRYNIPTGVTINPWIIDFAERIRQLQKIVEAAQQGQTALKELTVWLGGLFSQEAYVTATRQCVAQCKGYSLEELRLQVSVHGKPVDLDSSSFGISGLKLMGAEHEIDSGKLKITEDIMTDLAYTKISWVREQDIILLGKKITLPVYLNNTRTTLVETLDFPTNEDQFYERGVAILCTPLS